MKFTRLHGLQPLDSPERKIAYGLALRALTMKQKNPGSRLWQLRVKQALKRLENAFGEI